MTPEGIWQWLTQASPTQFFLGVLVLVLGSNKILSEKNVSESFGGILLPIKFLRHRREQAAQDEASELEQLRLEVARQSGLLMKYHRWSVRTTEYMHRLDLWAAEKGLHLPKPPFVHWTEFERGEEEDDD